MIYQHGTYKFYKTWCLVKEVFGDGASPIQDFVSLSLKTYQAALRWTDSILFMFCCLYGFHTQDAYSSLGRTRVPYTVSLTLWLQPPSTGRKRPRVELAFLQMLSTCSFQLKLLDIVTPTYFAELTLDIGKQDWRVFTCVSHVVTFCNVKIKLPAFLPWR